MEDLLESRAFGMDFPSSSQAPDSSQAVPQVEVVKWQSTQPLPALNALLRDSAAPKPARRVSHSTNPSPFFFPDEFGSPDASSKLVSESRRTSLRPSSTRRTRPRYSDPLLKPASASPFSLQAPFASGDGQPSFVDMLKSVSKMVDENARIKKRHLEKQTSRSVPGSSRSHKSRDKPRLHRDELVDKTNVRVINSGGSAPRLPSPDADMSMDADQSSSAMDIDILQPQAPIPREISSSASKMPPPPIPPKATNNPSLPSAQAPIVAASTSIRSYYSPPMPPRVVMKAPPPQSTQAPSSTPTPPTSSFGHPPALGMRRNPNQNGATLNSFTSSQSSLPSKQKGFKPPLAKPSTTGRNHFQAPSRAPALQAPNTAPTISKATTGKSLPPLRSTPSSANDDPDSSFGELSFDMDILEEAMKEYDE